MCEGKGNDAVSARWSKRIVLAAQGSEEDCRGRLSQMLQWSST